MHPSRIFLLSKIFLLSLVAGTVSDVASDRTECTDQLMGLATCLPYVGGQARSPTPDCCAGFKQVTAKSIKCVCVLVKDKDDPSLGLNVNVTLALTLPVKCDSPANISTCPKLLSIPENSPLAKEFKDLESALEGKGQGKITSSSVKANSTEIGSSNGSQVSGGRRERNFRLEVRICSVLLFPFLVLMG